MPLTPSERTRRWREKHPEKYREIQRRYAEKRKQLTKLWIERNHDRRIEIQTHYQRRLRLRVIALLGGRCSCGFADERALVLDHKHGGGNKERRQKGTTGTYRNALKHPEHYQLLCANCNMIKARENGEFWRQGKAEKFPPLGR